MTLDSYKINLEIEWSKNPFPHAVIDNFLPQELFDKISKSIDKTDENKDPQKQFISDLELNKKVYGKKDLKDDLEIPLNIIGGKKIKEIIEKYLNLDNLISLNDWENYGGYYPFHRMKTKGLLGSHVDHSYAHLDNQLLHVANSIFYVSPKWEENWGGETILFNTNGLQIIKKILPKPNRLVLFIHSSSSFHGVNYLKCPLEFTRNTYYMDYYINENQMKMLNNSLLHKTQKKLCYRYHTTTFIPFFPLGLKSFKLITLFKLNSYIYLIKYLRFFFARYFLNYKFSKYLKFLYN